ELIAEGAATTGRRGAGPDQIAVVVPEAGQLGLQRLPLPAQAGFEVDALFRIGLRTRPGRIEALVGAAEQRQRVAGQPADPQTRRPGGHRALADPRRRLLAPVGRLDVVGAGQLDVFVADAGRDDPAAEAHF